MATTLYQIMIRIKDSFVPILQRKLSVSNPTLLEESDTYLKGRVRDQTEKLTESGSQLFHEVIAKDDHVFRVAQEPCTRSAKKTLLAKHETSVTLHRRRERYTTGGVEVSIDRIDDLGTFLEIEGPDRAAVESVATTLGFSSPQFIEHPYDWLKR